MEDKGAHLSIHKLGHVRTTDGRDGAAGATAYYERATRGDHEAIGVATPPADQSMGIWYAFGPHASRKLDGYQGMPEDLEHALRGEWRGQAVQNAHAPTRVLGWDLTFSAAKSISVAYAAAAPEDRACIEDAMIQSVLIGLREVAVPEVRIRRGHAGAVREPASFAAIVYGQHLSRANDPQLHCHCVLPNYGWGSDGIARTLETAEVYRARVAIGQVAGVELAARLQVLGYEIFRDATGDVRVAGVSPELEAHFAKRSTQIEKALRARFGPEVFDAASPGQRELVAVLSRPRHDLHYTEDWRRQAIAAGLERAWHEAAQTSLRRKRSTQAQAGKGMHPPDLVAGPSKGAPAHGAKTLDAVVREATAIMVHAGGRSVARREAHPGEAVPTLRRLVEETAARAIGTGANARAVLDAVERTRARGDIETLEPGLTPLGALVTTAVMIRTEQMLVTGWQALAGMCGHEVPVPRGALDGLSPEQQDAVRAATVESGIGMITGLAGTGKTTVFERIRQAYEARGYCVVGEAYSAAAAQELQHGSGIASRTIALAETTGRHLDRHTVLVLDEAGRIPSGQMARIVAEVRAAGGKLILSGDWRQLQPIGPGAALPYLAMETVRVAPNARADLQAIRRQTDPQLRQVAEAAAAGHAALALRIAAAQERVTVQSTTETALHEAARHVAEALERGSTIGLVAYRVEAEHLNQMVRGKLQARGRLPEDMATYRAGQREIGLAPGDLIAFTQNRYRDFGVRNGQRAEVVAVNAETRTVLVRLTDSVREGRQGNAIRGGVPSRFHDGTREHVISQPERTVILAPEAVENGLLRHDYARTVDAAQGVTVDRAVVFTHYDTQRLDRQWGAVAFTRARYDVRVVLSAEGAAQAEQAASTFERGHWPLRGQDQGQQLPVSRSQTVAAVLSQAERLLARDRPGRTTLGYPVSLSAVQDHAQEQIARREPQRGL